MTHTHSNTCSHPKDTLSTHSTSQSGIAWQARHEEVVHQDLVEVVGVSVCVHGACMQKGSHTGLGGEYLYEGLRIGSL